MFAPPKKTKQSWPHLQLGQDLTYKDLKRKKRFSLNIQDGWRKIVGHGHNHSDEITNNNEWTNMGIPFLIHLVDHKQTNPWKNNEIYICSQYLYLYIWGLTLFWGGDILGEYIFLEMCWIWICSESGAGQGRNNHKRYTHFSWFTQGPNWPPWLTIPHVIHRGPQLTF